VEKAAAPAPFISVFKAGEVKTSHIKLKQLPQTFAFSGTCEVCGRPATSNQPRLRCDMHRA
jgi:hypothetical protein